MDWACHPGPQTWSFGHQSWLRSCWIQLRLLSHRRTSWCRRWPCCEHPTRSESQSSDLKGCTRSSRVTGLSETRCKYLDFSLQPREESCQDSETSCSRRCHVSVSWGTLPCYGLCRTAGCASLDIGWRWSLLLPGFGLRCWDQYYSI